METIYCLKCKRKTESKDIEEVVTKNNRNMLKGICVVCGTKKSKFIGKIEGKGVINNMINKLPFEMHVPKYNYLGPGTNLKKRLDVNNKPKPGNEPINQIDEVAMHHDICYSKHEDTKTRNKICDTDMLNSLKKVKTYGIKEWLAKSMTANIIGAKRTLGLGNKKA